MHMRSNEHSASNTEPSKGLMCSMTDMSQKPAVCGGLQHQNSYKSCFMVRKVSSPATVQQDVIQAGNEVAGQKYSRRSGDNNNLHTYGSYVNKSLRHLCR